MTEPLAMSAPEIADVDEQLVMQALRSGILGLGPFADEFEHLCAGRAGVPYGIAVSSGTAGLHLIVRSLGIGEGDEVLVPSFTFAASANAFLLEGAKPIFLDIEADTFNLDPAEIAAKRTPATRAVMGVDVFGHPADWDAILAAAGDLHVIDDCCEAIGATYRGRPAGSFGVAGTFAFYPNKQMTTGEGGVIVTADQDLALACRSLRNQGRRAMSEWLHHELLGFNYRMGEMSAALGVSQIGRLDTFLRKRERVAAMYMERLAGHGWVRPQVVRPDVEMSWFVFVITLAPEIDRTAVMASLAQEGIPSRVYFSPLHLQPYIQERFATREGMLPITEDISRRTLALPFHNNLSEAQVERVVAALVKACSSS